MQNIKQHIAFRILSLLLVVLLFTPSAFKLAHTLSHNDHKHEVCLGEKQIHLHTLDLDCEFHKFQINTAFTLPINTFEILEKQDNHQVINSQYHFISGFQQLHFNLRGPPRIS